METHSLIGRDGELEALTAMVDRIGEHGGSVVVQGEPGVGKSSLLSAMAEHGCAAGLHVLATTGVECEAQLPFAGLHQVLRPLLGQLSRLPDVQRHAIDAAFGAEAAAPPEQFMIALAALNLLADAAALKPVLVVVDDLQWLDRPTQEVLAFVARRISADPVVVAGGVRTGHAVPFASAGFFMVRVIFWLSCVSRAK